MLPSPTSHIFDTHCSTDACLVGVKATLGQVGPVFEGIARQKKEALPRLPTKVMLPAICPATRRAHLNEKQYLTLKLPLLWRQGHPGRDRLLKKLSPGWL